MNSANAAGKDAAHSGHSHVAHAHYKTINKFPDMARKNTAKEHKGLLVRAAFGAVFFFVAMSQNR